MSARSHTAVLTIYLHEGPPLRATVKADEARLLGMGDDIEKSLQRQAVALVMDGRLLLIPHSSIRYIEIDPAPPDLPMWVVRGQGV